MEQLQVELSHVLNEEMHAIDFFIKGQIGDIYRVDTSKQTYILKTSQPSSDLQIEANMLRDINKYDISIPKRRYQHK